MQVVDIAFHPGRQGLLFSYNLELTCFVMVSLGSATC